MFVRFRASGRRLQASLVQVQRTAGRPKSEHLGTLGSVDASLDVRSRIVFWSKLPGRLAALGNRVGTDEHAKIYAALVARIPMVTPEEQRGVQEENAKDDERFWDVMRDMNAASVEEHKLLVAAAQARKAAFERGAAEAGERVEAAKDRLARLSRGESVAGGLGKKLDMLAVAKEAGMTPKMMKRASLMANLTPQEFETLLERTDAAKAADARVDRELRRVLRERG
jgi:hypothetical protein